MLCTRPCAHLACKQLSAARRARAAALRPLAPGPPASPSLASLSLDQRVGLGLELPFSLIPGPRERCGLAAGEALRRRRCGGRYALAPLGFGTGAARALVLKPSRVEPDCGGCMAAALPAGLLSAGERCAGALLQGHAAPQPPVGAAP